MVKRIFFRYSLRLQPIDYWMGIGIPLLCLTIAVLYPFGFRVGSINILPYPYFVILLVSIGFGLLYRNVRRIIRFSNNAKSYYNTITVICDTVHFPLSTNGRIEPAYFYIGDIRKVEYEAQGQKVQVILDSGECFAFEAALFDSPSHFEEFNKYITKK